MISNFLTGVLNVLSFLSLIVTTDSEKSFLAASFMFSASIFLEAMSLSEYNKSTKSIIIFLAMIFQGLISVIGMFFSLVGHFEFLDVYFVQGKTVDIFVTTASSSIYYIPPININFIFVVCGGVSAVIPLILCLRELCITGFRKVNYNLKYGLYGK